MMPCALFLSKRVSSISKSTALILLFISYHPAWLPQLLKVYGKWYNSGNTRTKSMMEKLESGAQKLGLYLSPGQLEQFEVYYRELVDWNRKINLTSITDYEEVQTKHFLDSLTVATAMPPSTGNNLRVIDVGTGAGLPGIPLKILLPGIRLTLLEATAKKAKFLGHLMERLGLDSVEIVVGRAEEAAHEVQYREKFDLVLSRAVASLPALVELTLPFCTAGGRFVAQKKGDIEQEVKQSYKAIAAMGGRLSEIRLIELEKLDDKRYLIIIDKVKSTPAEYPRRPGMPAKRPII
jgi:16S rRNA (guanine527-N7)-methyltransferase